MAADYSTELQEQLNCTFVLSSSLYFRLVARDPQGMDRKIAPWLGELHTISRDLAALSENGAMDADAKSSPEPFEEMKIGLSDLLDSLRDVAVLARAIEQTDLSDILDSYTERLSAKVGRIS